MTKPITPSEARKTKTSSIPPEVFQAFNELIADKLRGGYATVKQDDVVERIVELMGVQLHEDPRNRRAVLFDKGWMDVEGHYEKAGWVVTYDKPAYNESYEPTFQFKIKRP